MGQLISFRCPEDFSVHSYLRAARVGDVQEVQKCLQRRESNVNATSVAQLSAIHLATKEGHLSVVRELLHQNAHVNQTTQKGNTPLHIAAIHGCTEIAQLLIANGGDINAKSKRGYTPLYLAVMQNHPSLVRILLDSGADYSLGPQAQMTPLSIAEVQGFEEIVNMIKFKTNGKEHRTMSKKSKSKLVGPSTTAVTVHR